MKQGEGGGEVAYNKQHEIFQHGLEMAVARYSNRAINQRANESPDESRHGLRIVRHELQTECQAVDVRAIVRDDAEGEDDEAELTEAAQGGEEHGC